MFCSFFSLFYISRCRSRLAAASLAGHKKLLTATIARVGWKICSCDYICLLHQGTKTSWSRVQVRVGVPSYDWVLMSWEKCIKENQFPESQLDKWVYSCHKREQQESQQLSRVRVPTRSLGSNRSRVDWSGVDGSQEMEIVSIEWPNKCVAHFI